MAANCVLIQRVYAKEKRKSLRKRSMEKWPTEAKVRFYAPNTLDADVVHVVFSLSLTQLKPTNWEYIVRLPVLKSELVSNRETCSSVWINHGEKK